MKRDPLCQEASSFARPPLSGGLLCQEASSAMTTTQQQRQQQHLLCLAKFPDNTC
jgi:hypothetical protein